MRFWYAENGHRQGLCVIVFLQSMQTSLTFDKLVFLLVTRAPLLQFRQVPQTMSALSRIVTLFAQFNYAMQGIRNKMPCHATAHRSRSNTVRSDTRFSSLVVS